MALYRSLFHQTLLLALLLIPVADAQVVLTRDIDLDKVDIQTAIDHIGSSLDKPVLFGIEIYATRSVPTITLQLYKGEALESVLSAFIKQLPGHLFEVRDTNFVRIYSATQSSWVMEFIVPELRLKNEPPGNFIRNPRNYIPELDAKIKKEAGISCSGMGPGLGDSGAGVTGSFRNLSLRELLTAVSLESFRQKSVLLPLGWLFTHVLNDDGTYQDRFAALRSMPRGWKRNEIKP